MTLKLTKEEFESIRFAVIHTGVDMNHMAENAPDGDPDPENPEVMTKNALMECSDRLYKLYDKLCALS